MVRPWIPIQETIAVRAHNTYTHGIVRSFIICSPRHILLACQLKEGKWNGHGTYQRGEKCIQNLVEKYGGNAAR
jgi:hypothetical protein